MAEKPDKITLEIRLKGDKEPIVVACDRYEYDAAENGWLVLYRGDREIGRYQRTEIMGYHEQAPRGPLVF